MCNSFLVSYNTTVQLHKVNPGLHILSILENIEMSGDVLQNCFLSVPIYLPLGVDILELEQAGLQVDLFSLWFYTCHLE
jgi:hypothetical protein